MIVLQAHEGCFADSVDRAAERCLCARKRRNYCGGGALAVIAEYDTGLDAEPSEIPVRYLVAHLTTRVTLTPIFHNNALPCM